MSERLEWVVARETVLGFHSNGEKVGGNLVTHECGLSIGPLVLEGTLEELRALSLRIALAVDAAWVKVP